MDYINSKCKKKLNPYQSIIKELWCSYCMLLAGADINGDNDYGHFRYVAIVIGTNAAINTLFYKIGLTTVEMKKLKKHQRKQVAKNMNFNGKGFLALCLKIDRQKIIEYFTTHPHSKAKFIDRKMVYRFFDDVLFGLIRDKIDGFCQHYGIGITKLIFQCDPDMSTTIHNWGLTDAHNGKAYEFADAISFCYEHKWTPVKGCKYFDYSDKIRKAMKKNYMN